MRITTEAKHQTNLTIRLAARRLFALKGFAPTTTREIAREAGIGVGTLFNYYPTKESLGLDLIAEALEVGHRAGAAHIKSEPARSLQDDLSTLIRSGLRALATGKRPAAEIMRAALSPFDSATESTPAARIRRDCLNHVNSILERHAHPSPLSPLAAHLFWTLHLGILAHWATDESPDQARTAEVLDASMRLFASALGPHTS